MVAIIINGGESEISCIKNDKITERNKNNNNREKNKSILVIDIVHRHTQNAETQTIKFNLIFLL